MGYGIFEMILGIFEIIFRDIWDFNCRICDVLPKIIGIWDIGYPHPIPRQGTLGFKLDMMLQYFIYAHP